MLNLQCEIIAVEDLYKLKPCNNSTSESIAKTDTTDIKEQTDIVQSLS